MALPFAFPDLPRTAYRVGFGAGMLLFIAAGLSAIWARQRQRRKQAIRGLALLYVLWMAMTGLLGWFFWPADPFNKHLPGFSIYAELTIFHVPAFDRKYIFEFASNQGAKISFYLSAGNKYTLSLTDVHGETYPIEANSGGEGVPENQLIRVLCETAILERSTSLRLSLNGAILTQRTLPFAVDLGNRNWINSHLGSNAQGNGQGSFVIRRLAIWPVTIGTQGSADLERQAER
jgi:hypothetical protein